MAYIGSKPNDTRQLARREFSYAVTVASTTTFTGSDAGGKTLSYQPGELEVYMNGVRLDPADYTATTGSSVVLGSGANIGDNINIFAGQILPTDDYVSKAAGGTFDGNLLVGRTSSSGTAEGIRLLNDGFGGFHRDGAEVMQVDRKTDDGVLISLRKDGTTIGNIGTNGSTVYIGSTEGADAYLGFGNQIIRPVSSTGASRDAAIDLGYDGMRFRDLYLAGGVYLGGTGSANKLDDYEEGEFNVGLTLGTGSATLTAGGNTLAYTKVGRIVTIRGQIRVSSTSSPGGDFRLTLPFASASGTGECVTRGFAPANLSANLQVNEFFFELSEGTAVLNLLNGSGTTVTSGSASSLQGNTTLGFNFSYRAT
jgi:hypothetical protein